MINRTCAYAYIFETAGAEGSGSVEAPRPFVIEPPLDFRKVLTRGEELRFGLVLFGRAVEYLPYFIFTFSELGAAGLGRERGSCVLEDVVRVGLRGETAVVYSAADRKVREGDHRLPLEELLSTPPRRPLSLRFQTPTRIKTDGKLVPRPDFPAVVKALVHRTIGLAETHAELRIGLDVPAMLAEAAQVESAPVDIRWLDWERYSSRQDARMTFGGFIGRAIYDGPMETTAPLVVLGQYTHIGKNTTFGLGKYEIAGYGPDAQPRGHA